MNQPRTSRAAWTIFLVSILVIEVVAMLAVAMDWPIKKYALIPNAILGVLVVGWICYWDWSRMKQREAEGEHHVRGRSLVLNGLITRCTAPRTR